MDRELTENSLEMIATLTSTRYPEVQFSRERQDSILQWYFGRHHEFATRVNNMYEASSFPVSLGSDVLYAAAVLLGEVSIQGRYRKGMFGEEGFEGLKSRDDPHLTYFREKIRKKTKYRERSTRKLVPQPGLYEIMNELLEYPEITDKIGDITLTTDDFKPEPIPMYLQQLKKEIGMVPETSPRSDLVSSNFVSGYQYTATRHQGYMEIVVTDPDFSGEIVREEFRELFEGIRLQTRLGSKIRYDMTHEQISPDQTRLIINYRGKGEDLEMSRTFFEHSMTRIT